MRCCSKKIAAGSAFSLVEVLAALAILALISSSVLVVINRCMTSAANSTWKMQAFEVARENMEKLLCSDSVTETVEYGSSDKYPDIQWQSTVDSFYEPITERMWIQAVCSAQYTDTDGQPQTVELTHWITDLTVEEAIKILEEKARLEEQSRQDDYEEESAEEAEERPDDQPEERPDDQPEERPDDQPEERPDDQPEESPPEKPEDSQPDWLPADWSSMTRKEKLNWLLSTLQW